jgi:hypothetical protein
MSNYQNITPLQLAFAAVTASDVSIYTTPGNTRTLVKDINIANTGATPLTINLHIVRTTDSVGTGNALMYGFSIAANTVYRWTGIQIMNAGDKIYVKSSSTGLTVFISGAEAV